MKRKDLKTNLLLRLALLEACKHPAAQKVVMDRCARDFVFWVDLFVFQYSGKDYGGRVGPFICWDFQEEAAQKMLQAIADGRDFIIEKSRDMGASWLCLLIILWHWLFHPWKTMLVVSKSAEAVDGASNEALFWKLDFILRYIPDWMKAGYEGKPPHRMNNFFGHPKNGSQIYGVASTGRAGVGAKCSFMFIDEFSQIKEDREVLDRTSDTTNCRIFNGTHLGLDTAFFELTDRNTIAGARIRKVQMHWSQHPLKRKGLYQFDLEKNRVEILDHTHSYPEDYPFVTEGSPVGGPFPGLRSAWYDDQCSRKSGSRAIAMDLDINPFGSVSQFFDPLTIRDLINRYASEPYWEGDVLVDTNRGLVTDLLRRPGGPLRLWMRLSHDNGAPAAHYGAGVDVSSGVGRSPSCLSIASGHTGEKVLEYTNAHLKPHEFAPVVVALCRLFKTPEGEPAQLCWETQGPGVHFGETVILLGYRNIYYRFPDYKVSWTKHHKDRPGWFPTEDSKRTLLEEYRMALGKELFLNRSKPALSETLKFKYSPNGRRVEHPDEMADHDPSGAGVNHGDLVIADSLCWKMTKEQIGERKKQEAHQVVIGSLEWRRQLAEQKPADDGWDGGVPEDGLAKAWNQLLRRA